MSLIFQKYILRNIFQSIFTVFLIAFVIIFFSLIIKEINYIGEGSYTFDKAIFYAFSCIPAIIYDILPIICLIGSMLGLYELMLNNEIIIFKLCNVSFFRINILLISKVILFILIISILAELIIPHLQKSADEKKAFYLTNGQVLGTEQGIWIRDKKDFIYIKSVDKNFHLKNIYKYTFDDEFNLISEVYAKDGFYFKKNWNMSDVESSYIAINGNVIANFSKFATWNLSIKPELINIFVANPNNLRLDKIYSYLLYMKKNHLNCNQYELIFWQRISKPILNIIMIALSIAVTFTAYKKNNFTSKVLLISFLSFIFYIFNQFIADIGIVVQLPAYLVALVPAVIFTSIMYILLLLW